MYKRELCMLNPEILRSIRAVSDFYDARKKENIGALGFRRASTLSRLISLIPFLMERKLLIPGESLFFDLGCGDGRVNVFFSYLVRLSVGAETDEWTLDEYQEMRPELDLYLNRNGLMLPPENIHLFSGDSTSKKTHGLIKTRTGASFEDFDIFYTYLTMYEEFGAIISERAKPGAVFIVYGMENIIPRLDGLSILTQNPIERILAIYQKR